MLSLLGGYVSVG